jgi:hypothetical protein
MIAIQNQLRELQQPHLGSADVYRLTPRIVQQRPEGVIVVKVESTEVKPSTHHHTRTTTGHKASSAGSESCLDHPG